MSRKRTTLYLNREVWQELKRIAKKEGVSLSKVVDTGLRRLLEIKEESPMKSVIREYVERLLEQGALKRELKLAKRDLGTEIRIGRHAMCGGRTTIYYYDPESKELLEGPAFVGQGSSNYAHRPIGLVEVAVTHEQGETWIHLLRVIIAEDEDLTYADDWEEEQFPGDPRMDAEQLHHVIRDHEQHSRRLCCCIVCGDPVLATQDKYDQDEIWDLWGMQENLYEEVLCRGCGEGMSVEDLLALMRDQGYSPDEIEGARKYITSDCGFALDDPLFG